MRQAAAVSSLKTPNGSGSSSSFRKGMSGDRKLKRSMADNQHVFYIRAFPHALLVPGTQSHDRGLSHCVLPTDRGLSMTTSSLAEAKEASAGESEEREAAAAAAEEALRRQHGPAAASHSDDVDGILDIDQSNSFQFLWSVFSRALAQSQHVDLQLIIRWRNGRKVERRKIFGRLDDVDVKMGLPAASAASVAAASSSSSSCAPSPMNSIFPMYFAITFPSLIVKALARVPGFGYGRCLDIEEIRAPKDLIEPLRLSTNRHVSMNQAVLYNGDFLDDRTYELGEAGLAATPPSSQSIAIEDPVSTHSVNASAASSVASLSPASSLSSFSPIPSPSPSLRESFDYSFSNDGDIKRSSSETPPVEARQLSFTSLLSPSTSQNSLTSINR